MDDVFYSPPKVAKLLGCAVDQVHQFIARGELRAFNLSLHERPRWKISEGDLKAFLLKRSNQAVSDRQAATVKARRVLKSPVKNYFP